MAEGYYVHMMNALNGARRAYNRAARAMIPEQENIELRVLGGYLMMVGAINTSFSYRASINPRAIPSYMHVMIPFVIQCFTLVAGIIIMATGWLLIVGDNPRQHRCLVNFILLLVFIASALAMAMAI